MSSTSAACASRSVSRASSGLGVGSPLGWLCTTSSAVVPGVRHAGTNTSGSEMGVLERVPRERTCQARRRWRVERHATAKTSTASLASSGASVAAAIRGSLRASVGSGRSGPGHRAACGTCRRTRGRDVRGRDCREWTATCQVSFLAGGPRPCGHTSPRPQRRCPRLRESSGGCGVREAVRDGESWVKTDESRIAHTSVERLGSVSGGSRVRDDGRVRGTSRA